MAKKKNELEIPYFYVSPKEYSQQTGLWIEDIKRLIRSGELEGTYNEETGYYKVKVYKNDCVSRDQYEREVREKERYKTIVETFYVAAKSVGIEEAS